MVGRLSAHCCGYSFFYRNFAELDKLRNEYFVEITSDILGFWVLAPQLEARHKIIDKLIRENSTNQILEIAAGFSARGLIMTQNPSLKYVEFDLPTVIEHKTKIIETIIEKSKLDRRHNLFFEKGNALDSTEINNAARHFDPKPITIINEGFMRYLSFDEKTIFAKNVHYLLQKFGGQWITSDITLKKMLDKVNEATHGHHQKVAKITGIDVDKNRFENEEDAKKFFANLGFSIERHSFMEVWDELVSPKNVGVSDKDARNLIENAVVYIMRIND